ncbi:MAG: S-adenosylmethionine synthase [Gammaproteobacteria bacterium SG8_11]|nr:MAG: S-adenosylmethionine synthase [Gammaproteobacteria bacterium SG8_11]
MVGITVNSEPRLNPALGPVEIVERKGIGHPDTICDALAEELSLALCRYYREQFGLILHHNVDKALLWGGASQTAFNGGRVIEPMEIFLAGRATLTFKGVVVPVEEILVETGRQWLKTHLHALDAERHVKLHTLIRPGSADLVDLYLRQQNTGVALANDTSCGVGYAPLDELERLVYGVEKHLNSASIKTDHPEIGEDIKVMGVRQGEHIQLTIGCAFVDHSIKDMEDYAAKKAKVVSLVIQQAKRLSNKSVAVEVNTADGDSKDSIYLTVTGTSAEAGDDGEVGRGNRVNGLITPYRPMNMEAAAGKNPVTHVGKLYNIVAQLIADTIVDELPAVQEAQCYLVSRIGKPIHEPQVVDLKVQLREGVATHEVQPRIREICLGHLSNIGSIQDQLLKGTVTVY